MGESFEAKLQNKIHAIQGTNHTAPSKQPNQRSLAGALSHQRAARVSPRLVPMTVVGVSQDRRRRSRAVVAKVDPNTSRTT